MKPKVNFQHMKARPGGCVLRGPALSGHDQEYLASQSLGPCLGGAVWSPHTQEVVWGSHCLAFSQGSRQFLVLPAQGQSPGHCYREPDPQRDPRLSVRCGCRSDHHSAGIPLLQCSAQCHLYPQPGYRLGQKPDCHLVCQILGSGKGQLELSAFSGVPEGQCNVNWVAV